MAKKSKATRQYNKQLQRQQKILRKAQQKGIKLDLSSTQQKQERYTKKDVVNIRKRNVQYSKEVKAKPTTSSIKLTNKQIQKAIQGRKRQLYKPEPIKDIKLRTKKDEKDKKPKRKAYLPDDQRKRKRRKPKETVPEKVNENQSFYSEAIIANYLDSIRHYPSNAEPILRNWLNSIISKYGKDDVATMLQEGANNGVVLTYDIAYDNEKLQGYIADMLDFLPEMTEQWKEDVMEAFESWADVE